MSNYVGAVRFPDNSLRFFSYQGTCDIARRLLFSSAEEVEHEQSFLPAARTATDEEEIEVMPYFNHGSDKVMFHSRASRSLGIITGPVSMDEAYRESAEENSPFGL